MPLTDPQRIAREAEQPFLVALWRALVPLTSLASFMNTGAHPDDEISDMMAKLGLGDGLDISFACSTRGEGGQNDIGREATKALGVLRTAEMERAADVLGMRMYWLSETPDDTIFDFGFSKSGTETLAKWDRERTLKRFVDILRLEKPDIVCTTFLDVPGQHGHHRAMTLSAEEAIAKAADPTYRESELPVWEVAKFFLPAWSGAGRSYDDDLPPPPATIEIPGDGFDAATGLSFGRLGQQSRACHQTQAMGRWVPRGTERGWPLHLKLANIADAGRTLTSGLPAKLSDLGPSADLETADREMAAAVDAFPDADAVLEHACAALKALRAAAPSVDPRFAHKVARKDAQLCKLVRIAARVDCRGWLDKDTLRPTDAAILTTELYAGNADSVEIEPVLGQGWSGDITGLRTENAPLSDPYPSIYLPDQPDVPCLSVQVTSHGVTSASHIPLEVPPQVLPDVTADITPTTAVINRMSAKRTLPISLRSVQPSGAVARFALPEGWSMTEDEEQSVLVLPETVSEGLYEIGLEIDGMPANSVQSIVYPHVAPRHFATPAAATVRVVDAGTTNARIGYVGAGNDRVDYWLENLGLNVTTLSADDLTDEAALARFDTILIGIFAIRFRSGLKEAMPKLHHWIENGGTLVTLYHRPWDNWDPDTVPPARLEIGQPSLRWRVTDETAKVTCIARDHPVLTTPNAIGPDDWAGWHKERGLYFAKSWDAPYQPLLEMADPDEEPHHGALLAADIGKGRHIHCALILHHQMEKLVPGAFRLMVNLVTPRS